MFLGTHSAVEIVKKKKPLESDVLRCLLCLRYAFFIVIESTVVC